MTSFIKAKFRRCRVEDYADKSQAHFEPDQTFKDQIKNRLCPEIEPISEHFKIKNDYTNLTERNSFHLEISKCTNKLHPKHPFEYNYCKEEEDIKKVLKELYFTLYVMQNSAELGHTENYKKAPIHSHNKFHSQF